MAMLMERLGFITSTRQTGIAVHACNPRTWRSKQEDQKSKAILDHPGI